jgi:hypothetical protein|tara:strand:+ start:501 stop:992 length:492 start_codon:yes stop_codon:yes gene_type:complete
MTIYCQQCNEPIKSKWAKKFCGSSCAAKFNNTGKRRHGQPPNDCLVCGEKTGSVREKYCSITCSGVNRRKYTEEERKRLNRESFMRYYMRKKKQTPPDADFDKIKEIYLNCPAGYEVDHIIPVSKGGLHHQDNLQYLTISENRRKSNSLNWPALRDSNSRPTE